MSSPEAVEYPWMGSKPQSAEGFICLPVEVLARLEKRTLASLEPNDIAFVNRSSIVIDTDVQGAMMIDEHDELSRQDAMDKFDPRYHPAIMRILTSEVDGFIVDYRYIIEMEKHPRLTDGTTDSHDYKVANDKHGTQPVLGFVVLGNDGRVIQEFHDDYDLSEYADYMMQQVDERIPEILRANQERVTGRTETRHELALAAMHLLNYTKRTVTPVLKSFLSFVTV